MTTVQKQAPQASDQHTMKRDVGIVGLLFASVGSIIGSGWLFGALDVRPARRARRDLRVGHRRAS